MAKNGYEKISTDGDTKKVSLQSAIFLQWMNIIFKKGNERALEQSDFLPLSEENRTSFVIEQLQSIWKDEQTKSKQSGKKPKLWKSVLKIISVKEFMTLVSINMLFTFSRVLLPLLLGYLIASLTSAEPQQNYLLYGCALVMGINALVGSLSMHYSEYRFELWGIRISSAIKGLVYLKTLLLSNDALIKFSTGHVIDLVSNDVQRLEGETFKRFLKWPSALIELIAVTLLLVFFIGWQSLMGVIILLFLIPYFAVLSSAGASLRLRTAAISDRRISLMNQVVSGIRAIKTHAWEQEYREKIKHIRRQEISVILKKSSVLSGIAGLEYTSAPIATLVSVITLVLTGQPLTPVNVFMLVSFINVIRQTICSAQAYGFQDIYDAYVSLGRLEEFLLLDNLPSISRDQGVYDERNSYRCPLKMQEAAVVVSGLTKKQIKRENEFVLQDINFIAAPGSFTVVTGPVGSGKSILLSAIARMVSDISGTVSYQGTVVYVPQIPWVFSGTIRENILFGEPYDEPKYTRTIEACALVKDFQQFPDCDQTVVGERGAVLSGGQRARISLARAAYADADIYLLDDPLSALDFRVGQHVFDKCISDLLSRKTRILTSHQEQHMQKADNVMMMYKGRMLGSGGFPDLKDKGFLSTTVDPLYLKLGEKLNENDEVVDSCSRVFPLTNESKGLQISEEDRTIGVVSYKLYWNYFRSGVPSSVIFAVICLCLITQGMIVSPDVWLSFLSKRQPEHQRNTLTLKIYGCLVGVSFIFAIIRAFGFYLVSLRCSERLHDNMVFAVLRAPVLFFDSNPVGRIMNRFSKDIGCVDEVLPKTFLISIQLILLLLTGILIPIVTNPWLLFVVVPMTVFVVYISRYYLKTSRELKRLESICRSPVFSHIAETLNGLDTIRTRGRQRDFVDRFYRFQDIHNQSFILVMASGRWLGVRLDLLTSLLIALIAVVAVVVSQDAAFAGLAIVYGIQTVNLTQYAVKKASEVENLMTSVERVITYTKLDSEPGYEVTQLPPEHWPREGNIALQDVSLTYYPGGPQVLKKVNVNIKGGSKIGVSGRTGAGKSSFVAAFMRMPDADGDIIIDDVQIKGINLQSARRCISVLGQSPVLFSGSLRENLDLMEQFQDVDLWRALEDVQLKDLVESLDGRLDHELLEHGANVSVGERQLICLARVLLQRNKIIILDEPTAHVDPDTEQTIWNVVREKLRDATVITIAHRLNTIKDCDMILVFKSGEVADFDKFDALVSRKGSTLGEIAQITKI